MDHLVLLEGLELLLDQGYLQEVLDVEFLFTDKNISNI
jgi:hypothetical protein